MSERIADELQQFDPVTSHDFLSRATSWVFA